MFSELGGGSARTACFAVTRTQLRQAMLAETRLLGVYLALICSEPVQSIVDGCMVSPRPTIVADEEHGAE